MKKIALAGFLAFSLSLTLAFADSASVAPTAIGQASTPLSAALGGTGNTGGAFTPYTPTVACAQSTGTAVCTAAGRSQTIGKIVFISITITVSGTFTAGTITSVSLPSSTAATGDWTLSGRERGAAGLFWDASVLAASSVVGVFTYNNLNTIIAGNVIVLSGWYEQA